MSDLLRKIGELAEPAAMAEGCELFDVEIMGGVGGKVVRVYIDKEGGVTVNDCAKVSRQLSLGLDTADLVSGSYKLEVSSPGLTRQLKKPAHFKWALGRQVQLTFRDESGKIRDSCGEIISTGEHSISILTEQSSEPKEIELNSITKANLKLDF